MPMKGHGNVWKKVGVREVLFKGFVPCLFCSWHPHRCQIYMIIFKEKFMNCVYYFEALPNHLKIKISENKSPRSESARVQVPTCANCPGCNFGLMSDWSLEHEQRFLFFLILFWSSWVLPKPNSRRSLGDVAPELAWMRNPLQFLWGFPMVSTPWSPGWDLGSSWSSR